MKSTSRRVFQLHMPIRAFQRKSYTLHNNKHPQYHRTGCVLFKFRSIQRNATNKNPVWSSGYTTLSLHEHFEISCWLYQGWTIVQSEIVLIKSSPHRTKAAKTCGMTVIKLRIFETPRKESFSCLIYCVTRVACMAILAAPCSIHQLRRNLIHALRQERCPRYDLDLQAHEPEPVAPPLETRILDDSNSLSNLIRPYHVVCTEACGETSQKLRSTSSVGKEQGSAPSHTRLVL